MYELLCQAFSCLFPSLPSLDSCPAKGVKQFFYLRGAFFDIAPSPPVLLRQILWHCCTCGLHFTVLQLCTF